MTGLAAFSTVLRTGLAERTCCRNREAELGAMCEHGNSDLCCVPEAGAGAGHEFSGAPFSLAMAAIAVALFVGEAYQRQAAGETFDLQAVTAKVMRSS